MWLSNHGFDIDKCHEEEMREGPNSRENCWDKFVQLAGKNRENIPRNKKTNAEKIPDEWKEICKSVSQEPLLPGIDLDKFNGESLHVYQGVLTHQNGEVYKKLNKESDNAEGEYFYSQAELCQQYIMECLELEESEEFVNAKKVNVRIQKAITKAYEALAEAEKDHNQRKIKIAEDLLEKLQGQLQEANLEYNYHHNLCLVKGAKEFDRIIDSSENNKNTRMTKSAFLFRSAIRLHAGFFTAM